MTRKEFITALDKIADGQREGKTAKQLAGEVLIQAKRLWRFGESREWVAASCIEKLTRKDFDARPVKREVTLRLDELAEVWRALNDPARCKSDSVTVAAMKLLILTGQRERSQIGRDRLAQVGGEALDDPVLGQAQCATQCYPLRGA